MKITFKRSFIIGILIFLQILLLVVAGVGLNFRVTYLYNAVGILNIVAVIILIYSRDNPTYKLTWIVIILVFPLFGLVIYFLTGTRHFSADIRRRMKASMRFNSELRHQEPKILEQLKREEERYARQAQYLLSNDNKPVYRGTQARLLTPGDKMFEQLLVELEKARKFIFLEYFIIAQGNMWDSIFSILKRKAAQGLEVRIIYDDIGSIDRLPKTFKKSVADAGIKICNFNPFMPVLNKFMNYRDHRKITVIDGTVGFTGGINIGDEYINLIELHDYWKDTSIMLRGDAVWSLTVMFLDMWQIITGEKLHEEDYRPEGEFPSDGYVQPFQDNPVDDKNIAESVYMQMINNAERYVYISTPYLIIDNEMLTSLCLAAQSGVDVRIVTPGTPDKWYVHMVTRSNYQRLLENGVKIYEYLPGFIHAKTCVCDDEVGVVGSINLDYRSFFLQFECAVWLCRCSVLKDIKEDLMTSMRQSRLIDLAKWKKQRRYIRIIEMLLNLLSPLM